MIQIKDQVPRLEWQLQKEKCISYYFSLADSRQTHNNDTAVPVSRLHAEELSLVLGSHSFKVGFFPPFIDVSTNEMFINAF